jgi:hypothetical protein
MCLLLKIALLSVPLASSPAIFQPGMPVFTIVGKGMSGFNPSANRTSRFCCPLQKGNQEPGSLMLPGFGAFANAVKQVGKPYPLT